MIHTPYLVAKVTNWIGEKLNCWCLQNQWGGIDQECTHQLSKLGVFSPADRNDWFSPWAIRPFHFCIHHSHPTAYSLDEDTGQQTGFQYPPFKNYLYLLSWSISEVYSLILSVFPPISWTRTLHQHLFDISARTSSLLEISKDRFFKGLPGLWFSSGIVLLFKYCCK